MRTLPIQKKNSHKNLPGGKEIGGGTVFNNNSYFYYELVPNEIVLPTVLRLLLISEITP